MVKVTVKGSVVRAWARCAARQGILPEVEKKLSPATLAALRDPPLAGSWVSAEPLTQLFLAVYDTLGRAAAIKLSREAAEEVTPVYAGMLGGLLRLLGTSPASLFGRMNDYSKQAMKGAEFIWTATSERSGVMDVRYGPDVKMTPPQFLTVMPSFESVFTLCKVKGTVSEPDVLAPNHARFKLFW